MTTEQNIKLGKQAALFSFLTGTGIFTLYYLTSGFALLFLGYGFIGLTGIVNLVLLISLLIKAYKDNSNRKKALSTCFLMLLNIPLMLFYSWLTIILLNTMRITFTNSTQTILNNLKITGCENEYIDKLDVGESKTIWVKITGDCTINVNYFFKGKLKEENVAGYVSNSMGEKMQYNIGGHNDKTL